MRATRRQVGFPELSWPGKLSGAVPSVSLISRTSGGTLLPERFTRIDALSRASHKLLQPEDNVYFLGEYAAGADYVTPMNGLIRNFKIKPSSLQGSPVRRRYKEDAIREIAVAVTKPFSGLEPSAVIVPIPTSKVPTDPEYDRRLLRVLRVCRAEPRLDVRELIKQRCSTAADHEAAGRQSFRQLLANCYLDVTLAAPRPSRVILFDDVLTEGKHFKVCQRLLRDHYGEVPVVGCFIARSIQSASAPIREAERSSAPLQALLAAVSRQRHHWPGYRKGT